MESETKTGVYLFLRGLEIICIGAFVFGLLWEGTIVLNLSTPQYFMMYGGIGAVITEILARLFKKKMLVKRGKK